MTSSVDARGRRTGVATALMEAAMVWLKDSGAPRWSWERETRTSPHSGCSLGSISANDGRDDARTLEESGIRNQTWARAEGPGPGLNPDSRIPDSFRSVVLGPEASGFTGILLATGTSHQPKCVASRYRARVFPTSLGLPVQRQAVRRVWRRFEHVLDACPEAFPRMRIQPAIGSACRSSSAYGTFSSTVPSLS